MSKKEEGLSFRGLKKLYYEGFIRDVVEWQIIRLDVISAHEGFKACMACLSEHLGRYAPDTGEGGMQKADAGGLGEVFYAPAVKIASLLHRAGWKTWLRHNIPPFEPRYTLPTKIERLAQYGHSHLSRTPFKELIAEAERALGIDGKSR